MPSLTCVGRNTTLDKRRFRDEFSYMKNKTLFTIVFTPLLLLGWILLSRVPPSLLPSTSIEAPKENFLAPDIVLESYIGADVSLSNLHGKPIILNFWASWCPPCRAEMPDFQEAWEEYQGTDLQIISVNSTQQDSLPAISSFVAAHNIEFPILLDTNGNASASYQVHSLPSTFFINRDGIITKIIIGGPIPLSLLRIQADLLLQD